MSDELEQLANLLPLGYTDRDPYRNVFEAAQAILDSDWLNAKLAEAWDEGLGVGGRWGHEDNWDEDNDPYRHNPYRTGGDDDE